MSLDLFDATRGRILEALPKRDQRARARTAEQLALRVLALTDGVVETGSALAGALVRAAAQARSTVLELERRKRDLMSACAGARTPERTREILIEFLETQDTPSADLVQDRLALGRYLDKEALFDRLGVQAADLVDEIEVAYVAGAELLRRVGGRAAVGLQFDALLELAFEMVDTKGPEVLRVVPLRFVLAVLCCFEPTERFMVLGRDRYRRTKGLAENPHLECWPRIAAFDVLRTVARDDALETMKATLAEATGRDGMVVRNNLLRMVGELDLHPREKLRVFWSVRGDPSEHVRQGLARELGRLQGRGSAVRLAGLVKEDGAPRVRAFALRELSRRAMKDPHGAAAFGQELRRIALWLARDPDQVSRIETRVFLHELRCHAWDPAGALTPDDTVGLLQPVLNAGRLSPDFLEEVASVLVTFEVTASARLRQLCELLRDELGDLAEGHQRDIRLLPGVKRYELERALLVAARGGLPVTLDRFDGETCRIGKGESRSLVLWRVLHELRNPAPDKREAFPHTWGRSGREAMVVPPFQMGEVTPTRVPGERRQIDGIRCWGVFLPLVDEFLSALKASGHTRRLITSLGTVVVSTPRSSWGRFAAHLRVTWRYAHYARLRELSLGAGTDKERRRFSKAMSDLGFRVSWEHRSGTLGEGAHYSLASPAVDRYFGVAGLWALPSWVDPIIEEAWRPAGNTAWHLALVVWLVLSYMVLRAAWIRASTERSRSRIPLTVGGWGSRGKSGSERIKAALFHALRYDTVVKTTGCEAMFIHARRDLPARELYVYRPYGKATIWEQAKLLGIADRLRAQVFLWECMALRPQFVQLLEHEWMKDEVTTITNAYPDHEDVMGPSGEDVARVIGTFGTKRGVIYTAEQELLPIIREIGKEHESTVHVTTEIDAELLPGDLLARFPYAEHPRNVAMALAVAEHFGVDREWALVKMADHVVPDLGVLKIYPTVRYRRRVLTFSNGMSANERAGFMSNWFRLAFDKIDPDKDSGVVTVAVVNNRADRVPRSRVFAELLTRDVACDVVCIIGSNISGMVRFIEESLDGWLATLGLGDGDPGLAESLLESHCVRLRVLRKRETLESRVRLVLGAAGLDAAETENTLAALFGEDPALRPEPGIEPALAGLLALVESKDRSDLEGAVDAAVFVGFVRQLVGQYVRSTHALRAIREALQAGRRDEAERTLRIWLREVYLARLLPIWEFHSTGDQVIDTLTRRVAPGHHAQVLGCQNIKGTGLDFAYRWVSLGHVDAALKRLEADPTPSGEAIDWLLGHGDWGLLDALEAVRRLSVILNAKGPSPGASRQGAESLLVQSRGLLAQKLRRLEKAPEQALWQRILNAVEPLVDHLDAIRRHRTATRIMADLFTMRVSQGRAALLLRTVTERAYGGWLAQDVRRWLGRRSDQRGAE